MERLYTSESYHYEFNIGEDGTDFDVTASYKDPVGIITNDIVVTSDDVTTGIYYVDFPSDTFTKGIWELWYKKDDGAELYVDDGIVLSVSTIPSGIVSLDFVKSHLGITDTTYDVQIVNYIPVVESDFLTIRNAPFDLDYYGDDEDVQVNIVYPLGAQVIAANMVATKLRTPGTFNPDDIKGIKSEKIGTYSVTFDTTGINSFGYETSVISGIKRYIRGA